jgi:hypothetical protein
MLSVVEISSRIQNPNLVVPEDLSTLQELSTKYPYTQLFSILYLKALSKAGDPRFEEELSRHSYRISDRVQLYELIQDHDQTESLQIPFKTIEVPAEVVQETEIDITLADRIIETSAPIESPEEVKVKAFDGKPVDDEIKLILENNPITSETDSEPEAIVFEAQIEPLAAEIEPEPIVEETKIKPQDNLEESILHNAYAANYRLDDLTDEEEKALTNDRKSWDDQTKVGSEESTYGLSTTDSKKEENKAKDNQESSSFTDWLHSNNNYTERDTSDKEAINAVVEYFSEFDPSSELFGEVEKPKTEFFSPAKKAKKSLEESELPVSETLAKIYIMQGNYPQAISAYKQLSLAFPEKKIFFANLIKDLEKKLTNK